MGAHEAIRGFEYQFLRTLEYALHALLSHESDLTSVEIEGSLRADLRADQNVVDFTLVSDDRVRAVAQVKSGAPGTTLIISDVLDMVSRMFSHQAEKYVIITNRSLDASVRKLIDLLDASIPDLSAEVSRIAGRSRAAAALPQPNAEFWQQLRRMEIVTDIRDIETVRANLQELVRRARHRAAPATVGWDAAGLLTGYLVWEVMARAAGPDRPEITMAELARVLRLDSVELKSLMRERDWAVSVTPAARPADIARPELLARIAEHLSFPVARDASPVCLLSGLSGIGKTSLAAAWADEHAYAYAAIMWIDATSPAQITASFTAVAAWLGSNDRIADVDRGAPVRTKVHTALARSAQPWLLVFDNCSDQGIVREWIPPVGHGHILVTSTDQTPLIGASAAKIQVDGMTDGEAAALLARRLIGVRKLDTNEQVALRRLATRLHRWPLALELAAGYLAATELEHTDVVSAVAGFEELLDRAINDQQSVPVDYPDTVVGAISMTWSRLVARTAEVDVLAADALRSAAFLASRQIPLHLVLATACEEVDPSFPHYSLSRPPAGEVLRAMKRDSLVSADEPFEIPGHLVPEVPRLLNACFAMNDIVQLVLRDLIEAEDNHADVLLRTTFCTQAWFHAFSAHYLMEQAYSLLGHGIELSEHNIEASAVNQASALLWGNTAGILGNLDEWQATIRYAVVELTALDHLPEHEVVHLRVQTLPTLARAMSELADHPRDVIQQVLPYLEELVGIIPAATQAHELATAHAIRAALSLVRSFRLHGIKDPRLSPLEMVLDDFRRMISPTDEVDWFSELLDLNYLIRNGRENEAIAKAEAVLTTMPPAQPERFQVLRVIIEASLNSGDWDRATTLLTSFREDVRSGHVRRFDVATMLRNVGTSCLFAVAEQRPAAIGLFDIIVEIAVITDHQEVKIQAGDRDVIAVLRAAHAYLKSNRAACAQWLKNANLDDVASVEPTGACTLIHTLLSNWCALEETPAARNDFVAPSKVIEHVFRTNGTATPAEVFDLTDESICSGLVGFGAETAPARAIASVQVSQSAGKPPRNPLDVAVETCIAAQVLGLKADIAETMLQILIDSRDVKVGKPEELARDNIDLAYAVRAPHHVARLTESGHLADSALPQLDSVRTLGLENIAFKHPVVVPLPTINHVPMLRRHGMLFTYRAIGTCDVRAVAATLSLDRRNACHANAVFIAFQALVHLSVTGDDFVDQVENAHPQLKNLIFRTEHLIGIRDRLAQMPR